MNLEKYALRADSSFEAFEFISTGPSGLIRKMIHFQETNIPKLYNCYGQGFYTPSNC